MTPATCAAVGGSGGWGGGQLLLDVIHLASVSEGRGAAGGAAGGGEVLVEQEYSSFQLLKKN